MPIYFMDPINGNDANDGLSFANRKQTSPSIGALLAPGDDVRIMRSPDPILIESGTSWVHNQQYIDIDGPVTDIISAGETAWISDNAFITTGSDSGTYKTGTASSYFSVGAPGITGLLCHEVISPAKDFSAFQQISARMLLSGNALVAGDLAIVLCSDTDGLVPIDTVPMGAGPAPGYWHAQSEDSGGNLGASIQSVAIYAINALPPDNYYITNITACKSNNITHKTVVGKGLTTESYMAVRSLVRQPASTITRVEFETKPNSLPATGKGYHGDTETADTYIRPLVSVLDPMQFTVSGTDGAPITISGGWDDTDMSTQPADSETWWYKFNVYPTLDLLSPSFINVERLSAYGVSNHFITGGASNTNLNVTRCWGLSSTSSGVSLGSTSKSSYSYFGHIGSANGNALGPLKATSFENCMFSDDDTKSMDFSSFLSSGILLRNVKARGCSAGPGIEYFGRLLAINCNFDDNFTSGAIINSESECRFYNCTFDNNVDFPISYVDTATIGLGGWQGEHILLDGCTYTGTIPPIQVGSEYFGRQVRSMNDQGVQGALIIHEDGAIINSVADPQPTIEMGVISDLRDVYYPIVMEVPFRAIKSGSPATITVKAKRSSTDAAGFFRIRGGIYPGITNDLVATISGTGSYETLSLGPFTLTEDRVINVEFCAYSTVTGAVNETVRFKQLGLS